MSSVDVVCPQWGCHIPSGSVYGFNWALVSVAWPLCV